MSKIDPFRRFHGGAVCAARRANVSEREQIDPHFMGAEPWYDPMFCDFMLHDAVGVGCEECRGESVSPPLSVRIEVPS